MINSLVLGLVKVTRFMTGIIAFVLAFAPTILKMYETSHWFRSEDDPSPYDVTRDWFEAAPVPYSKLFHHHDKTLMRVYFFIVPYILCAFFVALWHALSNKLKNPSKPSSCRYLGIRSILGRTWNIPQSAQTYLGMPRHISTSEVIGITVFLILNIGTFAVRVKRSLPRGTRKLNFLVDIDEARGKEPIPFISWTACEIWAKTLGILAIMNLGWYLILPIGRRSVVLEALNVSWEHSVKYHRWVGYWTFVLVLLHSAMYVAVWIHGNGQSRFDPESLMIRHNLVPWGCNTTCDNDQFRQLRINFFGIFALIFMTIMVVFSLPWIRRQRFELFYYTHHLFVLVLIFLCLHYPGSFIYLIPGVAVYMVDKLYPLFAYGSAGKVQTSLVSADVLEVSVPTSTQSYFGGSYVFLNCPAVSWLQWHPFSLTSAPSKHKDRLTFHIKVAGDWTQSVIDSAKDAKENGGDLEVRLDGFYGHNAIPSLSQRSAVVLVGGGIGVTPMISVATDLLNNSSSKAPITLMWVVRTVTEFSILADDLASAMKAHDNLQVRVWITLSQSEPALTQDTEQPIRAVDKDNVNQLQDKEVDDRVLSILESIRNNKDQSRTNYKNLSETSSQLYTFNKPGLQPIANAVIMAISIIIALSAYAFTWHLEYVHPIAPEEIIIVIQMAAIIISMVAFVFILEYTRRIYYEDTNEGKSTSINNDTFHTSIINNGTFHTINSDTFHTINNDTFHTTTTSEPTVEESVLKEANDDITSHESLLISMIKGRMGSRPDLKAEFKSISSISNTNESDVAVLACGPMAMVETINQICNVPSSKCSFEGGTRQNDGSIAFFAYTEEDWEW